MTEQIYVGSAPIDAAVDAGWRLGHFKTADDVRRNGDVEVKWAVHRQGDGRTRWVAGEVRSALCLLISGRFRLEFPGRTVVLEEQGDYVVWHAVDHTWHAEEDAVTVVVRWPSVPGFVEPESTT